MLQLDVLQNPRYGLNRWFRLSVRQAVGIMLLKFVQKCFKVISKSHIHAITLEIEVSYIDLSKVLFEYLSRSHAMCLHLVVKLK